MLSSEVFTGNYLIFSVFLKFVYLSLIKKIKKKCKGIEMTVRGDPSAKPLERFGIFLFRIEVFAVFFQKKREFIASGFRNTVKKLFFALI